jgi:salicylate hydroxylase
MSSPASRIVIIGAGIGGLTLALLLRRRGITAEILEQAPELREVGAAVALAANGTRVLQHLDLGDGLAQASTEFTEIIHRDGRDGTRIAAHALGRQYREAFGAPVFGLHRIALQQLLAGAWGADHLHLGCRAETLQEHGSGMRVRCASGASFDADLVVGADGMHSQVRRWITGGDEPRYSGASGFRGLVPVERLPQLPDPGALQFWMGPGAHLLHYPIADGSVINFLAVVEGPRQWTAPAWMAGAEPDAHLEAFAGWHPAVSEMVGAVPQSPRWGLFALPPLRHWSRGPVVLLGDAAHGMLPHHGQGASQTIEDAAVLAAELDGAGDVAAAVRQYEARRRVRTRQVQAASWATSAVLHLPDGPAAQVRDAYLASLPERLAWIHGYDILARSSGKSSERRQNPARSQGGSR